MATHDRGAPVWVVTVTRDGAAVLRIIAPQVPGWESSRDDDAAIVHQLEHLCCTVLSWPPWFRDSRLVVEHPDQATDPPPIA